MSLLPIILLLVSMTVGVIKLGWLVTLCAYSAMIIHGWVTWFVIKRRKTHPPLWKAYKFAHIACYALASVFFPIALLWTPHVRMLPLEILFFIVPFGMGIYMFFAFKKLELLLDKHSVF